jgi:hypothetical protein
MRMIALAAAALFVAGSAAVPSAALRAKVPVMCQADTRDREAAAITAKICGTIPRFASDAVVVSRANRAVVTVRTTLSSDRKLLGVVARGKGVTVTASVDIAFPPDPDEVELAAREAAKFIIDHRSSWP